MIFNKDIFIMEPRKDQPLVRLSFDEVLDLCKQLTDKILETTPYGRENWQLWGVPRNGQVIAGMMAHCGDVGIRLSPPFTPSFVENNTIVVDDIHDSGQTLATYAMRGMQT